MVQSDQSGGSGRTTVAEYLAAHAVSVSPLARADAATLGVELPLPAGWETVPAEQFPGTTDVSVEPRMADGGFAPNAVLLVGSLSTRIDADQLLECSFTDARALSGWAEAASSSAPFGGYPSSFVRGTFVAESWELAVTTRYVVLDSDAQYLVQLTVTTLADQIDSLGFDIAAINDGLLTG